MKNFDRELTKIENQMNAELAAIQYHTERWEAIEKVISDFDGKMVTKRLQNNIKDVTGSYVGLERNSYNGDFELSTHFARTVNGVYASTFRSSTLNLATDTNNRLDAEKTMQNLQELYARYEKEAEKHTFDKEKVTHNLQMAYSLNIAVETLFKEMNYLTREEARKMCYYLR